MTENTLQKDSVLLIDDDDTQLSNLKENVAAALQGRAINILTWKPVDGDDAVKKFEDLTRDRPLLVVTDYDLTRGGRTGLFGFSIVALAQRQAIPVGDYSRQAGALTEEPDVFEFRVPSDAVSAGPVVAAIAMGFQQIRQLLQERPDLLNESSPAALLADLLGKSATVGPFSLYSSRIASGNAALIQMLKAKEQPSVRVNVTAYVAGHLLFNSILRYPGPILARDALCAYFSASHEEGEAIGPLFEGARYKGPFAALGPFYWQDGVDDLVDVMATQHQIQFTGEMSFDQYRRQVLEAALGREVVRHSCPSRCLGERGGYWCPFTKRPVCDRADCSVPSSSWVPEGASLTRVEKDFFDEWAPLMGL